MTNIELTENRYLYYVSDKLIIARLSRTIWPMFSSFLIFCFKSPKYEKLGKYWPYCTWNRVINNAYRTKQKNKTKIKNITVKRYPSTAANTVQVSF